jgi:hypothetical protein
MAEARIVLKTNLRHARVELSRRRSERVARPRDVPIAAPPDTNPYVRSLQGIGMERGGDVG